MTFSKVSKFIEENKHEAIFTGGTNENNIKWIEETLQVEFPESYKWFLKKLWLRWNFRRGDTWI